MAFVVLVSIMLVLPYGRSIDYLGYNGILKQHTQMGGTLISRHADGSVEIRMVSLYKEGK